MSLLQRCLLLGVLALAQLSAASIILVQDAGVDDYMCTVLLSHFDDFGGEVVVNADSNIPSSVQAAENLHALLAEARGRGADLPLSLSRARMYNAFPWDYRVDSLRFLNLTRESGGGIGDDSCLEWPFPDGDAWLEGYLSAHRNVTVVLTTAPTPLTNIFARRPELASSVSRVLWMGGAVHVAGNLDPHQFPWNNTRAEWNVYTDPEAAHDLLKTMHGARVPVFLFPLDIADKTPLDAAFFAVLRDAVRNSTEGTADWRLHTLVLKAYELVGGPSQPYYRLWDTVAAGYSLWPQLYAAPQALHLEVVTRPENMGDTRVCEGPSPSCFPVQVVLDFASEESRKAFIRAVAFA